MDKKEQHLGAAQSEGPSSELPTSQLDVHKPSGDLDTRMPLTHRDSVSISEAVNAVTSVPSDVPSQDLSITINPLYNASLGVGLNPHQGVETTVNYEEIYEDHESSERDTSSRVASPLHLEKKNISRSNSLAKVENEIEEISTDQKQNELPDNETKESPQLRLLEDSCKVAGLIHVFVSDFELKTMYGEDTAERLAFFPESCYGLALQHIFLTWHAGYVSSAGSVETRIELKKQDSEKHEKREALKDRFKESKLFDDESDPSSAVRGKIKFSNAVNTLSTIAKDSLLVCCYCCSCKLSPWCSEILDKCAVCIGVPIGCGLGLAAIGVTIGFIFALLGLFLCFFRSTLFLLPTLSVTPHYRCPSFYCFGTDFILRNSCTFSKVG